MYKKLLSWCRDSETLLLARLQMLVGILWSVLPTIDPNLFQSIIGDKWFGVFLIVWGVVIEAARRYRADDLK